MKFIYINKILLLFLSMNVYLSSAYTNLTPAEVYEKLVAGDSLILLDVREKSEYTSGHIAAPDGMLPITPVNMPLNSGTLSLQYYRLPKNIDIIVYCLSGGRSAAASSFLESNGFTRIYNMTGGFSSWIYNNVSGTYGDHTGKWLHSYNQNPVTILCSEIEDTSKILLPINTMNFADSVYIELHYAADKHPVPPDVPQSNINGLFRITVLDPYGLSLFTNDSLELLNEVTISLIPDYNGGETFVITDHNMTTYITGKGWLPLIYDLDGFTFYTEELVLRRWYNLEAYITSAISKYSNKKKHDTIHIVPNPFNSSIKIIAPENSNICIYDINGRLIKKLKSTIWHPDNTIVSGIYFINIKYNDQISTKKVIYLK